MCQETDDRAGGRAEEAWGQLPLSFQHPWLQALSSRQPLQRDSPPTLVPAYWSQDTHDHLLLACCVCALAGCLCETPLRTVSCTRAVPCLSESPLYQRCLAHSLPYRRYLMNVWMNLKVVVCSFTLNYKRKPLRVKLIASFQHRLEPGHLCFLSTERVAVRWLQSHPPTLFSVQCFCWTVHDPEISYTSGITSPKPALQLKQTKGLLLLGKLLRVCRTLTNDFRWLSDIKDATTINCLAQKHKNKGNYPKKAGGSIKPKQEKQQW